MRDIEAWLMQTDGEPVILPTRWQPQSSEDIPGDLPPFSELLAAQPPSAEDSAQLLSYDALACQQLTDEAEMKVKSAISENELTSDAAAWPAVSTHGIMQAAAGQQRSKSSSDQLRLVEPEDLSPGCQATAGLARSCSPSDNKRLANRQLLCDSGGGQLVNSLLTAVPEAATIAQMEVNREAEGRVSRKAADTQEPGNIGDEDYVDERQLMEYLRQLEMERSEELLLLEAAPEDESNCRQSAVESSRTGARPKVSYSAANTCIE